MSSSAKKYNSKRPLLVNTRSLLNPLTGVQRYALNVLAAWPAGQAYHGVQPGSAWSQGLRGHFWEQAILPGLARGNRLWSPANTGPIAHSRQVVTIHDICAVDHPEWFTRSFASFYALLWPQLVRHAAHIITDSQFSRTRIMERYAVPGHRITAIPLGVDAHFVQARPTIPAHLVAELEGRPFVLAVGSLEPRKNLGRLMQAWALARTTLGSDWRLVITGSANPRIFPTSRTALDTPQVLWTGRVADVELPGLYAAARVLVFPSLYEGFGFPPLEAMAAGVPVAASMTTSIPKVVGDAAFPLDPLSVESIATAITTLAHDESLRRCLIARGHTRVASLTWRQCAHQVSAVLDRLVR